MRVQTSLKIVGLLLTLSLPACSSAPAGRIEPNWSTAQTDVTPVGSIPFHGPFSNESAVWTADRLAAHDFVRVDFDLLILRSWDGSAQYEGRRRASNGPDYIRCSVVGGPTLLSTTFSNLPVADPGFYANGKTQNYPSPLPGDLLPPQTGAAAKNSLGYHYPGLGPPQIVPLDATYRISLLVPHRGPSLAVRLQALGLQNILDENWGVRDVTFTPLSNKAMPAPDDAALALAFATALDRTSTAQPEAVNTLVRGMDRTIAWIAAHVGPRGINAAAVAAAITDAGRDDHHIPEREASQARLFNFGPAVEPYLRDALAINNGETKARIELVLDRTGITPITDEALRRVVLATRVLEIIGTADALTLRRKLVQSD